MISSYSIKLDSSDNKYLCPDDDKFSEIHEKEIVFNADTFDAEHDYHSELGYVSYDKLEVGTKIYCSYRANLIEKDELIKPSAFYTFSPR